MRRLLNDTLHVSAHVISSYEINRSFSQINGSLQRELNGLLGWMTAFQYSSENPWISEKEPTQSELEKIYRMDGKSRF